MSTEWKAARNMASILIQTNWFSSPTAQWYKIPVGVITMPLRRPIRPHQGRQHLMVVAQHRAAESGVRAALYFLASVIAARPAIF
ncbi:MAG: hypothetical protein ABF876_12065 [Acetobacter aceti]|uniref:Uncharacterized protein n=1 Tax=Acetobacter aceti TaxID=435 RepID=A0A1U9KJQ6_ACEAC|nr:hypothetical protein [Acetobacter aceti]AQS85959.1 hypothetical protein A0U92_15675 [Acetobacter aceti]